MFQRAITFMLVAVSVAAATPALADPSGFVGIGLGPYAQNVTTFDDTYEGAAMELASSGVYSFTPDIGAQGDLVFRRTGMSVSAGDLTVTELDGAIHLFFRNETFLVGGFAQLGRVRYNLGDVGTQTISRRYVGAEAQAYFGNVTLYGQAGLGFLDPNLGSSADTALAHLELRYFLTDNLRLDAHVGFEKMTVHDDDIELNHLTVGIGSEYKFDDSPISLFGKLDYVASQNAYPADYNTLRILVGARVAFGEKTLLDRDRHGASLRPVEMSPLTVVSDN